MPDFTSYGQIKYNQVRARGSHNSYQRDEDLMDQLISWRLRHVELDLHNTLDGIGSEDGNWYVYHNIQSETKLKRFSDGLALLAGFQRQVPRHEVITVALDIKDGFDQRENQDHSPGKLDAIIQRFIPREKIFTPQDLLRDVNNPTKLQAGANRWPHLQNLRGKFIFILTTGGLAPGSELTPYVSGGVSVAKNRLCFVAPEIDNVDQIESDQNANAVFFNMTVGNSPALGPTVLQKGFISRGYGGNSQVEFDSAKAAKNHLIGTDNVNTDVDPWSRTHNAYGWPFQGIELTTNPELQEPGPLFQVLIQSDDIYGKEDNFHFRYNQRAADAEGRVYTWLVSAASSHVANENGKAGLMARAGTGKDAANFAVLRVADVGAPRVQVRKSTGANTSEFVLSTDGTPGAGINKEGWIWLRLRINEGGTAAEGLTSYDGEHWISLHREVFDEPLLLQGLAFSSHSQGHDERFYFLRYAGTDTFEHSVSIGNVRHYVPRDEFYVPLSDDA